MSRYSKESGSDFKQIPEGTHIARCVSLIDIGLQAGEYEGKPTLKSKVIIGFEVPGEPITLDDGTVKPMVISRFITNTLSERGQLRPLLEAWRGKAFTPEELVKFDLQNILGAPCLIDIVHVNGKARINTVMKLGKGMECPPQFNPNRVFWLDEWDEAGFESLSEGIKKLVRMSVEYKALNAGGEAAPGDAFESPAPAGAVDDFEDDIPF